MIATGIMVDPLILPLGFFVIGIGGGGGGGTCALLNIYIPNTDFLMVGINASEDFLLFKQGKFV